MIGTRNLQIALQKSSHYLGKIDGDFGRNSKRARDQMFADEKICAGDWNEARKMVALNQWVIAQAQIDVGKIDGFDGPTTQFALEQWQNKMRGADPAPDEVAHQPTRFPRQRDMLKYYGLPGTNHVRMQFPYPMRLAWDLDTIVTSTMVNALCADSAQAAFEDALEHYSIDGIQENGLDLYGGCFNNRKMRGGFRLSTHAFAAAFDINPAGNRLRWGRDKAEMAKPECRPFVNAFAKQGWINLGMERNYDYQHFQAVRL